MSDELILHKDRTNKVLMNLGFDVSGDTFTSEIRKDRDKASDLLATWDVSFVTDGVDGKLELVLPQSQIDPVSVKYGYMDVKRTSGSEDLPVFTEPLKVKFQGVVTE